MNFRQLQYAIALSEIRSFSHVADDLEITQPALSKQIISLENELGVKLFERSTPHIALTPAGESFIEKARELLYQKDDLMKTMERYKTGENGRLTIGVSPFRCLYMMPQIVKALKARYPGLEIVLKEYGRTQLLKGISDGMYDFIVTNLPIDDAKLEAVPLEKDSMVLAVPNALLSLIDDKTANDHHAAHPIPSVNLSDCEALPFVVVSSGQEMRQLFDKLCMISHLHPNIFVEVTGINTAWRMVRNGLAATILPRQFIQDDLTNHNVTIFNIEQDIYVRQPVIVTRRGQFISEYAQYAISLLKKDE